jgi:hypothetical protein
LGYNSFTSELIKSRKMKFNWCWSSETSVRSRLRVFVFFLPEGMDTFLPPAPEIQKIRRLVIAVVLDKNDFFVLL